MSQLCVPGEGLGFAYVVPSDHTGFYKALMGKLRPGRRKQPSQGNTVDIPGCSSSDTVSRKSA